METVKGCKLDNNLPKPKTKTIIVDSTDFHEETWWDKRIVRDDIAHKSNVWTAKQVDSGSA